MKLGRLSLSAGLVVPALLTLTGIGAGAEPDAHAAAVKACATANGHQPAKLVTAIDDGRGGSLVWLTDSDANLWVCSADAAGKIYAYIMMSGDLLKGAGSWLVPDESFSDEEFGVARPDPNPLDIAELACRAFFPGGNPGKVIGRGLDGLGENFVPGYFIFFQSEEHIYLCDATGDAQVWAFAEIGDPLNFDDQVG
jgi:hypothetical protein